MSSHSEIGYMISANVLGGNAELRSFAEDVGQRHCEEGLHGLCLFRTKPPRAPWTRLHSLRIPASHFGASFRSSRTFRVENKILSRSHETSTNESVSSAEQARRSAYPAASSPSH